jgi:hypothetical protein
MDLPTRTLDISFAITLTEGPRPLDLSYRVYIGIIFLGEVQLLSDTLNICRVSQYQCLHNAAFQPLVYKVVCLGKVSQGYVVAELLNQATRRLL